MSSERHWLGWRRGIKRPSGGAVALDVAKDTRFVVSSDIPMVCVRCVHWKFLSLSTIRGMSNEWTNKVMGKKIHWAGGLKLPKARMLPGWPCCCSGRTAERVAAEGNQTRNILEVTCQRCKVNMVKAGLMEKV